MLISKTIHRRLLILVAVVLPLGVYGVAAQTPMPPGNTETPIPSTTSSAVPTTETPVNVSPSATASVAPASVPAVEVFIPDSVLNVPAFPSSGETTMGRATISLTLFANGKKCAEVSLTDSQNRINGGKLLAVPGDTATLDCRTPGARLTLVNGQGFELNEEFRLELGARFTLVNLIPKPPHTGETSQGPITPPTTGSAGRK